MADHLSGRDGDRHTNLQSETLSARGSRMDRTTRRVEQRLEVDTSVVLHLLDIGADVQGRIMDVSLGGCHVRTDRRFPVGVFRRVEIEFRIDGLPFRLGGVTQAIYDPANVGIRFLDLSDRKREQLLQLIDEIKGSEQLSG